MNVKPLQGPIEAVRQALAGQPGHFYAIEAGRTLGTPFPCTHPIHEQQRLAVVVGAPFAGFIAEPVDTTQEPAA
jgi:hypothetical protein